MRTLERNKQTVYYANYMSQTALKDENGYETGQYHVVYTLPVEAKFNVSPAKGEATTEAFGKDLSYDKTIVANKDCPITETSVLWVDTMPTLSVEGETTTPHDYIVTGVAKSQNSVTIAIEKVQITRGDPPAEEDETP